MSTGETDEEFLLEAMTGGRTIPPEPTALPCPAEDELTELLALLLERAYRRRHPVQTTAALPAEGAR